MAEGKKINLTIGAQWHSRKKKERAGSELGRGFEVRPSIGRRSSHPQGVGRTGLSAARLSSYILPALAVRAIDPSQIGFLRCGGLSHWGARAEAAV